MAVINWCYGAKKPDIETSVSEAIYKSHVYRNRLCELELRKRERHEELLQKLVPEYVALSKQVALLELQLEDSRAAIQRERIKQKTKTPTGIKAIIDAIAKIKSDLKQARETKKDQKKQAYERAEVIKAMERNATIHKADCGHAKDNSGLYWGTEAIVRQATASFSSGAPPRFKKFDGTGQLAVQLQGGIDCKNAISENTLCYFDNIKGKKADCLIRIGSDFQRQPIFARIPIVMHRPLPEGRIKWAYLERRKIADHTRYSIRLNIDIADKTERTRDGEVAIHVGWRKENHCLRVVTWLGSDGDHGTITLSDEHCSDYLVLDKIRSERDISFNSAMESFRTWVAASSELPDWILEIKPWLHVWKSQQSLAKTVVEWRSKRIAGDEDIFDLLDAWRKKDKHRWQNESRLSVRICRRRKDQYRKACVMLQAKYGVAYLAQIEAKLLTENTAPEELSHDNTQAHRHAKWAAVSEFTQCVREAFGMHCIETDCKNITRQCVNCGQVNENAKGKTIRCTGCDIEYDIDENGVANTLARGEAAMKSGALLAIVDAKDLKASNQSAKLLKMQAANRTAREKAKQAMKT